MQSVGQGRPVALPEPTPEDAATDEAEVQNSVPTFLPAIFSAGGPRSAAEEPGDDAPETDAVDAVAAPSQPALSQPVVAAVAAARPAGLASEDLDRLKTILGRLEECRQLLDQAVGSAG